MVHLSGCGGMVDTLASGASGGNPVEVQVLSSAPNKESEIFSGFLFRNGERDLKHKG